MDGYALCSSFLESHSELCGSNANSSQPQRIGAARVRLPHGAEAAEGVYDCMFYLAIADCHLPKSMTPLRRASPRPVSIPSALTCILDRCTPRWFSGASTTVSMTLLPSRSSTVRSSVSCAAWTSSSRAPPGCRSVSRSRTPP